jgi:hypothetical protein
LPEHLQSALFHLRPGVAVLLYGQDGAIELKNDCNSEDCNQNNQGVVVTLGRNG